MKTTTNKFKTIMASGNARNYLIKIDLTLADNTVLHLTESDIWEDSFAIDTASSGTDSFDIGSAVIGKCTFTINNIDGDFDGYDFFNANAVVWLGLEGDATGTPAVQQYYRMGFFTVDEPQIANGLISLELLDYMWKFDVPLSGVTLNYPVTALSAVQALCSYCGVTLSGTSASFHGYNYSIPNAPKDVNNMNCREMLQYIAMLGCNFCTMNDEGKLEIKWYDVDATASTTDVFELNSRTSFSTEDIEITGVKFVIDNTAYTIGSSGYVLELQNPLVTADNVNAVLNLIWDVLDGFTLRTFDISTASDLAAEIGDKCKIRDYQGNYIYSFITNNSFKFAGHDLSCGAEPPQRTLVKRYSKTVQAAVEVARQETEDALSNYDLAVQMMNDLAVNAMGGYEDYEDLGTGGRVWYLSNMPITKTGGVCSFEPNSTVYKRSGSGFFVSRDGGITWVNGYDAQTGELVVNVLDAIGINFDWARGGTLTLGGYGNGNGILSILNSANVEKVHGDNDGIKVGGTTGSRIHITTNGEIQYLYDDVYNGRMRMDTITYGSDTRDTLLIDDFNDISIRSDDDYAEIHLSTDADSDAGEIVLKAYTEGQNASELTINSDGIIFNGNIKPDSASTGQDGTIYLVGSDFKSRELIFRKGVLTSVQQTIDIPHYKWHTWEVSDVTYDHIVLSQGDTQATFPDIDTDNAYDPFIQVADGESPPKITDIVKSGTSITVTFTEVTSAQASGNACVIKLMEYIF